MNNTAATVMVLIFLLRIITFDETWVHHYTPESNTVSMEWRHTNLPSPKKLKTQRTVDNVMVILFCENKEVIG